MGASHAGCKDALSGVEVRRAATAFAPPIRGHSVLQLLTSFGPFIIACTAMHLVTPTFPLPGLAQTRLRSLRAAAYNSA